MWFLVSRSFNSQQSQKEDTTQEGAKAIRKKATRKNLGRKENLQKSPWSQIPRNTWTFRGDQDQQWPGNDSLYCSDPVAKLSLCTLLQSNTPNSFNNNCGDSSSRKQSHAGFYTYTSYCPLPLYFLKKRAFALQIHQDKILLLASFNLFSKG